MESADITLMRGDVRAVPQAIAPITRHDEDDQANLFWAFIYNVVGIPIAAGVLFPFTGGCSPIIASRGDGVQQRERRLEQPEAADQCVEAEVRTKMSPSSRPGQARPDDV